MPQDNPSPYIRQYKHQLDELTHKLREDLQQINEPQARALMETSAEVLQGLYRAFDDYQEKDEAAWQPSVEQKSPPQGNVGPSQSSSPTHG